MIKSKDILGIFKVGITLFLITAISALVLAVVNSYTAPVIAENTAKKQAESMKKVVTDAINFNKLNTSDYTALIEYTSAVTGIYEGVNSNGEVCGYAVLVSSGGYGGDISMAVGISDDLKVLGIDIITQTETPGLGSRCEDEAFKAQFVGKESITVVKSGAKEDEIDAISGATRTSNAVAKGVNTALAVAHNVKGGVDDE